MLNYIKLIQDSSFEECVPGAFHYVVCLWIASFRNSISKFVCEIYGDLSIFLFDLRELLPIIRARYIERLLVFYFILISEI